MLGGKFCQVINLAPLGNQKANPLYLYTLGISLYGGLERKSKLLHLRQLVPACCVGGRQMLSLHRPIFLRTLSSKENLSGTTLVNGTVSFYQSDYSDEQGRLQLVQAYACTVYSSQGATIDGDTFVLYTTAMDRAASYVAGSRHKDQCHWFVNGKELDAQSGQADKGQTPDMATRLKTLARCMSINKHEAMASEYIAEQEAEQEASKQSEQSNDNELAA